MLSLLYFPLLSVKRTLNTTALLFFLSLQYHAMLCISTIAWELDEELSNRLYNVVPLCTAFLSSQVVLNDQEALERTCISIDYLAAGKPLFQKLFHAAGVVPMVMMN